MPKAAKFALCPQILKLFWNHRKVWNYNGYTSYLGIFPSSNRFHRCQQNCNLSATISQTSEILPNSAKLEGCTLRSCSIFAEISNIFTKIGGIHGFLEHLKTKVMRLIQKTSYILGVLFSDKWMYIDCEQHPFPVYKQFREMVFWAWLNKNSYHSVEHGLKKNQHMSTLPVSWLE